MHELELRIEYLAISSLSLPSRVSKRHSKKQIKKISALMRRLGMLAPLFVNEKNQIVCGVGRYLAAKDLGAQTVPVIRITHLSEDELKL